MNVFERAVSILAGCSNDVNASRQLREQDARNTLAALEREGLAISRYRIDEVELRDSLRLDIIDTEVRSSRHVVGSVHVSRNSDEVG